MRLTVVLDCLDPDRLVRWWEEALAYREVEAPAGYRALVPADGEPSGPVLILQRVDEPRVAKNRMHLDVHPPDPQAHVDRLLALGGRRLRDWVEELADSDAVRWQVLADPEGNELCVVEHL